MVSGEWLRGSITSFRDDVFLFDSEKFGDLSIDWADVVEIYSPGTNRWVRDFDESLEGHGHIVGDDVTIETAGGEVRMRRSELTAILPGRERELSRWSGHLAASFNGNWGASRQTSFGGAAWVRREDSDTRLRLDYTVAYGHSKGVVNVNNMWLNGGFDLFLSRVFYITPVFGQVGYNEFLNLDLRGMVGAGAGAKLVDRPRFEWDVSAGASYLFTRYVTVQPTTDPTSHDLAVMLGTTVHWDITRDVELDLMHTSMLVPTNFDITQFDTQAMLSMDVWKRLELDVTFKHTRIREPRTRSDGTVPDKDQFQLLVGLGLDL